MAGADSAARAPLKIVAGADSLGAALKNALVAYAKEKGVEVEDLGEDKYYSIAEEVAKRVQPSGNSHGGSETKGLLVCGTGMGVSMVANKYPGVYAAVCENVGTAQNARSINNSNVLALGGMHTSPDKGKEIFDAWLATEFRGPCPASGGKAWTSDVDSFLANSVGEMAQIRASPSLVATGNSSTPEKATECPICFVGAKSFEPVEAMVGGSWQVVRKSPTSAYVRFVKGSIEPAHHHTHGHDVVVLSGRKRVYNLSAKTKHDLGPGDYLFTPAGDVHRVVYFDDVEFFIKWDGPADILLDEDLPAAKEALSKEVPPTS